MVEGVRTKNYYISGRTELLNAVHTGQLDDTLITSIGIPSLSTFILGCPNVLVTSLDSIQRQLLHFNHSIWRFYNNLLVPIFPYFGITTVDMLEYLSIVKSYSYEVLGFNGD